MSRNYDNWERLVAAVVKREQIWQLCHQDSVSTIYSDYSDYSSRLDYTPPVFLGSINAFEVVGRLRDRIFRQTDLVRLVQDVQVSDQQFLPVGTEVVVKSLSSSKITQDEFEGHMIVLGNCRHENVGTPWACHFSETKKLIFYDYYSHGSVFDILHGKSRESNTSRPNWRSRLRIAVGAARGIAHIHTQCGEELIHGNIKSSNIFINSQQYGFVSDFGLAGVPGIMEPKWWDALEYYSSEHKYNRPSQSSDVYNFGLVLLELLTGRSPVQVPYIANHLRRSKLDTLDMIVYKPRISFPADGVDYMEEIAPDKFPFVDVRLVDLAMHEELKTTLLVAKRCLDELPEQRPTMSQVVSELENIAGLSDDRPARSWEYSSIEYRHVENKKRSWLGLFPFGR